ncbi:MAG: polyprenyl synthetase family protein, partial [Helicobacter sp.]|nr:polyprenyl synthetase family protein [Helicobacter sp.]
GLDLGLFFQICDDIIDATKSVQEAGKTTQQDRNKNSYVNLLGVEKSRQEARKLQQKIKQQLKVMGEVEMALEILFEEYLKV